MGMFRMMHQLTLRLGKDFNMGKQATPTTLTLGARVRLHGQRSEFTIVEGPNRKGEWKVAAGSITVWAPAEQLTVLLGIPAAPRAKKRGLDLGGVEERVANVDLHGQTVREALEHLDLALDRALRENAAYIDVIHGIGTGALLEAVQGYMKRSKHIKRFEQLERNKGTTRGWL